MTSGVGVTSDVTGQVKVKIRLFGLGDNGKQNFYFKQRQRIGMDCVSDICKYHFLCLLLCDHTHNIGQGHLR